MGRYHNPWPSFARPSLTTLCGSIRLRPRSTSKQAYPTGVISPDFAPCKTDLQVMWIGHATVYLQYRHTQRTLGILFDPIWSERYVNCISSVLRPKCSPCPLIGPKRGLLPPSQVSALPCVDLVVISHDHYDHLDKKTIRDIERYHPGVRYFVPRGLKNIVSGFGVPAERIIERGWWEEASFKVDSRVEVREKALLVSVKKTTEMFGEHPSPNSSSTTLVEDPRKSSSVDSLETLVNGHESNTIKLICTPAQHNSGRGLLSQNMTLWASWIVELPRPGKDPLRIFFGGDTGYRSMPDGVVCPIFREIRERYGCPDLALLPISAGSVFPFLEHLLPIKLDHHRLTSSIHCAPADAVEISRVMGAKRTMGIHWGTFTTPAHAWQTLLELQRERKEAGISGDWDGDGGFRVADIGEWLEVSSTSTKNL